MGRMAVALGGRVAEEIMFDDITTGAQNDLEKVNEIAREIDDEIRRIVEGAHQVAKDILSGHREQLETISEILLKRETIEREEFEALLEGKTESEIWGADKALPPGTVGPEVPGTVTRPEAGPRPIPRPGYAAELRGLDLPEKPDLA
jgi:cell division protease FtsH